MTTTDLALKANTTGLARYVAENDQVMIAGDLLLFKKGTWYRAGNAFKPDTQTFLANPDEAMTGWVKWDDGKPADHHIVRIADYAGRIPRNVLGDLDKNAWPTNDAGVPTDPWQPSDRILLRTMDSGGGRNALASLMGKVARSVHYRDGKFPVIHLCASSYEHDSYGIVHVPEFKIVDWDFWDREKNRPRAIAKGVTPDDPRTQIAEALNDAMPF